MYVPTFDEMYNVAKKTDLYNKKENDVTSTSYTPLFNALWFNLFNNGGLQ